EDRRPACHGTQAFSLRSTRRRDACFDSLEGCLPDASLRRNHATPHRGARDEAPKSSAKAPGGGRKADGEGEEPKRLRAQRPERRGEQLQAGRKRPDEENQRD